MNLLREFRENALRMSRPKFAAELSRSVPTLEKYEAEIPEDLLEDLAVLAEKHKLPLYAQRFRMEKSTESKDRIINNDSDPETAPLADAVRRILRGDKRSADAFRCVLEKFLATVD
jgi:hypothetical protein